MRMSNHLEDRPIRAWGWSSVLDDKPDELQYINPFTVTEISTVVITKKCFGHWDRPSFLPQKSSQVRQAEMSAAGEGHVAAAPDGNIITTGGGR